MVKKVTPSNSPGRTNALGFATLYRSSVPLELAAIAMSLFENVFIMKVVVLCLATIQLRLTFLKVEL